MGIHRRFRRHVTNMALLGFLLCWFAASAALADRATARCPEDAIAVSPGMSVQDAATVAGPGARICIKAGVHRMQFVAPLAGQQFFGEEGAILNGSRVVTAFVQEGRFWIARGQNQQGVKRGVCRAGYSTCELPVGVFVDGQPLRQVASRSNLERGTFFFDHIRGELFLADNPDGKQVEATVTRYAFRSFAPNVLVKGLTVEKYYNPAQEGAIDGEIARGWRVENCEIRFNSGAGVSVGSDGVIRNNRIYENGQLGATAGGTDILIEGNAIWGNNIYGFDRAWESGGVKVTASSRVTFRANHAHHNAGPGLWCDIDCIDVLYEDNTVEFNEDAGIFHEISYAATIRNNTARFNGQGMFKWIWGADILIAASENVEVYGNRVTVRPDGTGIILVDQNRHTESGKYFKTQKNSVFDNDITLMGRGTNGGASDARPGDENFGIIQTGGNQFDRNVYRVAQGMDPVFLWGQRPLDFAGFLRAGQEKGGKLVARPAAAPERAQSR